jgi:hypothetical protein
MIRGFKATAAFAVVGLAVAAGRVFSDDDVVRKPSKDEMSKMMAEAARPVEQHQKMAADAGTWDGQVSCWMDPKAEPTKSKASTTASSILGGLWSEQAVKGEMDGKPFEGRLLLGYSKEKQKYVGIWISSLSSTPEIVWGTSDASGREITFEGDPVTCPMGKFTPRWIVRRDDADHTTFEHWSKAEGAAEFTKGMEIKYTRSK